MSTTLLLGSYSYDGARLTATAQLLDMRAQKLCRPLPNRPFSATWGIFSPRSPGIWSGSIRPISGLPKDRYVASVPPMRLDALETTSAGPSPLPRKKIQHYREAVRLNPAFPEPGWSWARPTMRNASTSRRSRLREGSESSKVAREANFYLGLSSYAHGDFDKAERAFEFVAAACRWPRSTTISEWSRPAVDRKVPPTISSARFRTTRAIPTTTSTWQSR